MVKFKAKKSNYILTAVEAGVLCECQPVQLQRGSRSKLERDFVNEVDARTVKSSKMSLFCSSVKEQAAMCEQKFQPGQ